jgi:PatG C-terminal
LVTTGFLQVNSSSAFNLVVPADTTPRILRLYVRTTGGNSQLTATLPGFANITDQTLYGLVPGSPPFVDGVYTIAYQLPSGSGSLTVNWQPGSVAPIATFAGLQAATLQVGVLSRGSALQSYLDRIHFELRNMGVNSGERALNYAASYATNQVLPRFGNTLFGAMFAQGMVLEGFETRRNNRCRPLGDCWDVSFTFFNPSSNSEWARTSFRITVDVSLVKPLNLGQLQRWNEF